MISFMKIRRVRQIGATTTLAFLVLSLTFSLSGCVAAFEAGRAASGGDSSSSDPANPLFVGDTAVTEYGLEVTVTDAYPFPPSKYSTIEKDFLLGLDLTIVNNSGDDVVVSSLLSFDLVGANGQTYEQSYFADVESQLDGTVKPGRKLVGTIVFDADEGTNYFFTFKPGFIEDDIEFQITQVEWSE